MLGRPAPFRPQTRPLNPPGPPTSQAAPDSYAASGRMQSLQGQAPPLAYSASGAPGASIYPPISPASVSAPGYPGPTAPGGPSGSPLEPRGCCGHATTDPLFLCPITQVGGWGWCGGGGRRCRGGAR